MDAHALASCFFCPPWDPQRIPTDAPHAFPPRAPRLVHKIRGPAASADCELPPTPAEAARLDAMSLDELLAEWRAATEVHSRGAASAYRGVSWDSHGRKWRMHISNPLTGKVERKRLDTEEAAARAYDARARVLHGRCVCQALKQACVLLYFVHVLVLLALKILTAFGRTTSLLMHN